jgi:hypothetical protein
MYVELLYLQDQRLKSCIVKNVNLNKKQNEKHTRITKVGIIIVSLY